MKSRFAVIGMAFAAVGTIALGANQANADGYSRPRGYVAPYNWSGIYGGASVGWMANNFDWAFNPAIAGAPHQAYSLDSDRAVFGVHAGYQHQFGSFVVGVEAGYTTDGDKAVEQGFGVGAAGDSVTKMSNIFTVGPRLGYIPHSKVMIYTTGGYARADIQSKDVLRATGADLQVWKETHNGWFWGGGVEYLLSNYAMIGLDYKRLDLGTEHHCFQLAGGVGTPICNFTNTNERDIKATADIFSARLTFKWGREDRIVPLK
jgi:outer membrane immunogenic protein